MYRERDISIILMVQIIMITILIIPIIIISCIMPSVGPCRDPKLSMYTVLIIIVTIVLILTLAILIILLLEYYLIDLLHLYRWDLVVTRSLLHDAEEQLGVGDVLNYIPYTGPIIRCP